MRQAFRWFYEQSDTPCDQELLERAHKTRYLKTFSEVIERYRQLRDFDIRYLKECEESFLIGVDEVGRGPLAGPLVACCVRLPSPCSSLLFLRDSKKLSSGERDVLAQKIENLALGVGYGVVEATEFGGVLNLHHLTFEAMRRAVVALLGESREGALLVDGKYALPHWSGPQRAVIKGDDLSLSIAAASVLAKVFRDRRMKEIDAEYPQYGFAQHVGYGTAKHREALLKHGPCPYHRANFLNKIFSDLAIEPPTRSDRS